jgi:ESS family glutamate:Na+ symporter
MTPILLGTQVTATIGLLVFLIGAQLTRRIPALQHWHIPEPVTGGILAALVTLAIFLATGREVEFTLTLRDYLLILFFSAIGLNARLTDLRAGGRPLAILIGLTVTLILLQNVAGGAVAAALFGLPFGAGVLVGSASLIGGHGTTIAWAPTVEEITGITAGMELGIATATLGLILAAVLGGPVAGFLITRHRLAPGATDAQDGPGMGAEGGPAAPITAVDVMRALFWLNVAIILGLALDGVLDGIGFRLPSFVSCMLMAILIANIIPRIAPGLPQASRTPALAVIADVALGVFLAMSLMSMQLWQLGGMGVLLVVALALQTAIVLLFALFGVFRLMGRDYQAAVLASGVVGFGLGATPTAIANMNAVTKTFGPAPIAFLILPLVSAFFVDIANALAIRFFIAL